MTREQHKELFVDMVGKSEEEINAMADTGMFNDIIKGYCLIALERLGLSDKDFDFRILFDEVNAYEAREAGRVKNEI